MKHIFYSDFITKSLGFNIIELLITLSIIMVVAVFGVPSFKHFFEENQDELLQTQLLNAISLAKSESQIRHVPVAMCKSKDLISCDAGDWQDGQLIFIDENRDGIINDPKQIISVKQAMQTHGKLHWRSYPVYRDYLLFLPLNSNRNNGTFWHCHQSAIQWAIVLSQSGRTRILYPDNNNVIKDGRGHALSCL